MKKFLFFIAIVIACSTLFASCSYNLCGKIRSRLSEESLLLYSGEGTNFFVTLTCGLREEPYILDGTSQPKVHFSVITVTYYKYRNDIEIPCSVIVNQKTYDAVLEKNTVNFNYMTDLEIEIKETDIEMILEEERINMICKSLDFKTSSADAIELAAQSLDEEVINTFKKASLNYECYLKIINNPIQHKNVYFWHFSIKNANEMLITLIIDTASNNILAKF